MAIPVALSLNLVGYGRISGEGHRDNTSLAVQKEAIRHYCQEHGHRLVAYYEDVESGSNIENRENFQWALETVSAVADGLIVYRLDRLTRSSYDGERLKMTFQTQGKQLLSVMDTINFDSEDGSFVFTINAAIAELERKKIAARCGKGREKKREDGGYIGGCPPYGYVAYHGTLVELPSEQKIISQIKDMYMGGYSLAKIAAELNKQGVPTKKRLGFWSMETVRRIISGDSPVVAKLRLSGKILPACYWEGLAWQSEDQKPDGFHL